MNYADVKTDDIVNGWGLRVSLWVSGCKRHCKGCFNQAAWDFNYGKKFNYKSEAWYTIALQLANKYVDGLTILGGEPFEPENIVEVTKLCETVKRLFPDKNIWVYTGYTFEELLVKPVMKYIDVLVDGEYKEELRDLELWFRGSSNQRIINVKRSLEEGKVVLWSTSCSLQ